MKMTYYQTELRYCQAVGSDRQKKMFTVALILIEFNFFLKRLMNKCHNTYLVLMQHVLYFHRLLQIISILDSGRTTFNMKLNPSQALWFCLWTSFPLPQVVDSSSTCSSELAYNIYTIGKDAIPGTEMYQIKISILYHHNHILYCLVVAGTTKPNPPPSLISPLLRENTRLHTKCLGTYMIHFMLVKLREISESKDIHAVCSTLLHPFHVFAAHMTIVIPLSAAMFLLNSKSNLFFYSLLNHRVNCISQLYTSSYLQLTIHPLHDALLANPMVSSTPSSRTESVTLKGKLMGIEGCYEAGAWVSWLNSMDQLKSPMCRVNSSRRPLGKARWRCLRQWSTDISHSKLCVKHIHSIPFNIRYSWSQGIEHIHCKKYAKIIM